MGLQEGGTWSEALDVETPAVTDEPLGCFQGKTERVLIRHEIGVPCPFKKRMSGNSLAVQWLGLGTFTAEGLGSVPGQGTKILQAACTTSSPQTTPSPCFTFLHGAPSVLQLLVNSSSPHKDL